MTTQCLADYLQDEQIAALEHLQRDQPDAAEAVFGDFHLARLPKHTIDPATGEWIVAPFIATIVAGRIVSDMPETGRNE